MRRIHVLGLMALLAACEGPVPDGDDAGPCEVGSLGCECARGDRCGTASDGEALVCDQGLCVPARCAPGSQACVCRAGSECEGDGLECRDGVCRPADCSAGDMGCECLVGACQPGLYCHEGLGGGTCVDATGWPGGPCPDSGLCRGESRCDNDTGVCIPCSPGSQGCVPRDGSICNEGLVLMAGRCVPPPPTPPTDPRCHTPCRQPLVEGDGTFRACTGGFLDGCIDDQTCVDGTCVADGEDVPSCASDVDCPTFQTCIAARCYSTCERDSECPAGLRCHDLVCRVPCTFPPTADTSCPEGTFCDSDDGRGGVCMPLGETDADAEPGGAPAVFDLSAAALSLGSGTTALSITLEDARTPESFTVERVSHRAYDRDGRLVEEVDRAAGGAPLDWLSLSFAGHEADGDLDVTIDPSCTEDCPVVEIAGAAPSSARGFARWEGTLRVSHPRLGARHVVLSFSEGIDGRWSGSMRYYANFDDRGVSEWSAGDRARAPATLRNALLLRWIAFRNGALAGGSRELSAMLGSVATGSWSQAAIRDACLALVPSGSGACYPYDARSEGVEVFTANLAERPIPSGMMELPIALDLRADSGDPTHLRGRIESGLSLHEAGDPTIELSFASAPGTCTGAGCTAYVDSMSAVIGVGGRYRADDGGGCSTDFVRVEQPWLVEGLGGALGFDDATGTITRAECRDRVFPFTGADSALNPSFAAANPIPDGRPLRRTLRALDGALVDGETMIILFEERFDSFLDPSDEQGFSAYGTMVLRRQPTPLDGADYTGNAVPDVTRAPLAMGLSCDPDLVALALDRADGAVSEADAEPLSRALIEGVTPSATLTTFDPAAVHSYCADTGLIDGGAGAAGGALATPIPCPAASNVTYFAFTGDSWPTATDIAALSCQTLGADGRGTCGDVLSSWRATRSDVQFDPVWACSDGSLYCDVSRTDLTLGRTFYRGSGGRVFTPLADAIQVAFRYKLRFRSPDGRSVGFAPVICEGDGLTPYCYDPAAIEEIRQRMDCLVALYDAYGQAPEGAPRPAWQTALQRSLSESLGAVSTDTPLLQDGFERLYAELLIMLGDEALTRAYRSRFDTAAATGAVFRGSAFEPGGIDLSGVAGYEMRSLYQATQHYQLALDRLYDLAPTMYTALRRGDVGQDPVDVVTPETATWYLDRVIRGAAQKAGAWSEIARRYHEMHRPDLARRVLERAYAGSYLESIAITRLMHRIAESAGLASRDQLFAAVEDAQRRYRIALTEMREVHEELDDQLLFFGYTAEYVPFPVRDSDFRGSNPFEDVLFTTQRFVDQARATEEAAIGESRSFDTDAAQFQEELVQLTRSYEDRLGPICGYFEGSDGRTYPAITSYAYLDERAALLGDPCGRMGNGEIHQLVGRLRELSGQVELVRTRRQHVLDDIETERTRVQRQCGLIVQNADYVFRRGEQVLSMQDAVHAMELGISAADRANQAAQAAIALAAQPVGAFGVGDSLASSAASSFVALELQNGINALEHEMQQNELETARWQAERQCDALQIDLDATTASQVRQAYEVHLEALQVSLQLELAMADLRRAVLSAQRLQQELADAEELAIRVESAENDPNVRLYRNDVILNADASFDLAIRHVYRLTRVYEYYTSESYADLDRLFRIRMVARGADNLDRYLADLEDAFLSFEEERHASASRVERLSLMTDIFDIPRSLPQGERERLFHERLGDPSYLDANGHVVVPFRTDVSQLSPCTRNHKIDYIEVAIQGADLGDDEADVMIWQEGTAVVESFDEGSQFYRLPPQLSIAQAYFGRNNTVFDPSVYRRMELRDRPYADTQWRLELDLRDDPHNTDVVLANITDIYLYVYYTDFTDTAACRR